MSRFNKYMAWISNVSLDTYDFTTEICLSCRTPKTGEPDHVPIAKDFMSQSQTNEKDSITFQQAMLLLWKRHVFYGNNILDSFYWSHLLLLIENKT